MGEELSEGAMHRGRDRAVAHLELARGARRRPGHPHASGEASQLLPVLGQGVGLELVKDLQPVLDRSEVLVVS